MIVEVVFKNKNEEISVIKCNYADREDMYCDIESDGGSVIIYKEIIE